MLLPRLLATTGLVLVLTGCGTLYKVTDDDDDDDGGGDGGAEDGGTSGGDGGGDGGGGDGGDGGGGDGGGGDGGGGDGGGGDGGGGDGGGPGDGGGGDGGGGGDASYDGTEDSYFVGLGSSLNCAVKSRVVSTRALSTCGDCDWAFEVETSDSVLGPAVGCDLIGVDDAGAWDGATFRYGYQSDYRGYYGDLVGVLQYYFSGYGWYAVAYADFVGTTFSYDWPAGYYYYYLDSGWDTGILLAGYRGNAQVR
ncbi:hypothetical protein L6R53_20725 [Myxococcota bacterium]|nr:hypothetical protein [Myxococcota bacterium]